MNRITSIETLQKVYWSNADLRFSEFVEIAEAAGCRLTGGWDSENGCPEIVPVKYQAAA